MMTKCDKEECIHWRKGCCRWRTPLRKVKGICTAFIPKSKRPIGVG